MAVAKPLPQLRLRTTALMVAAAFGAVTSVAFANPQGAKVVSGSAAITSSGSTLVIKNTPGAIINWQSFSIGAGETTNFIQQSVNSAVLNRVIGVDPSLILGTLTSNGRVYLVNPNGVVFGKGAIVDAAGLVVSSLDITDQDFKNGTLRFVGSDASGSISVAGVLRSTDGDVYLIAPNVTNAGSITAVNGNVTLAAGQDVEILGSGLTDIQFNVQNKSNSAVNLGQINGDAVGIFAGTITQAGGVNATTATVQGGKVILSALGDVSLAAGSSTSADSASGTGGSVAVQSVGGNISVASGAGVFASGASGGSIMLLASGGADTVTGQLAASGTLGLGGSVEVLGSSVGLNSGASVDASGATGGGQILIGGAPKQSVVMNASSTSIAAGAMITADATEIGNGGHVVAYSSNDTSMMGSIAALGGTAGGNGGMVETSGEKIDVLGSVSAAARSSTGKPGEWLLDPASVTIDNGGTNFSVPSSEVNAASITAALNNDTDVTIATSAVAGAVANASITVNAQIGGTGASIAGQPELSLLAGGNITINDAIQGVGQAAGDHLNILMVANGDGNGIGTITLNAPVQAYAGNITMTGVGFSNLAGNSVIASSISGTFSGAGAYSNAGTFDASGDTNGVVEGGSINIRVTSSSATPIVVGNMFADGGNNVGGDGGTINFSSLGTGAQLAMGTAGNQISATGGSSASTGGFGGLINISSYTGIGFNTGGTITAAGGAGSADSGAVGGEGGNIRLYSSAGGIALSQVALNAVGGDGGGAVISGLGQPLSDGGGGGHGGTIAVSGVGISLSGGSVIASGGVGADGAPGKEIGVTAYSGSNGGVGGPGGQISILSEDPSLVNGALSLIGVTLDVSGGPGGAGGSYTSTSGGQIFNNFGGDGGAGGTAGAISLYANGDMTLTNSSLTSAGGAGGAGGAIFGPDPYAVGGDGGNAGNGGQINLTTDSLNATDGTSFNINIFNSVLQSVGGAGGAGGLSSSNEGGGGNGGTGGNSPLVDVNGNPVNAINITAAGSILIDPTSVIQSAGGNGGDGASAVGIDPPGLAIGPGNGGNGGTAGTIYIATNTNGVNGVTLAVDGTIEILGGNGGVGGNLSGTNITALGLASLVAGNGGNAGDAGYVNGNGALSLLSPAGSVTVDNSATIQVVAGAGGAGGLSNDFTFGPGNGGNGGEASTTTLQGLGDTTMNGNLIILGGAGGNGGNSPNGANNPGGTGGNQGYADNLTIQSDGGSVQLGGTINYDKDNAGSAGSGTDSDGNSGNGGSYTGNGVIALIANGGSVEQNNGGFTSAINDIIQINATAQGEVNLTQGNNEIGSIQGTAYGGNFSVNSEFGMGVQDVSAQEGSINFSAPALYFYATATGVGINLSTSYLSTNTFTQISAIDGANVNISADTIYITSGTLISTEGNGGVEITTLSEGAPIYMTADSYLNSSVSAYGSLILGAEFFGALQTSSLSIGNVNTPSIALQSYSNTSATLTIPGGTELGLTASTISNDSYTQLAVDSIDVVSNTATLSNVTSASGGAVVLSGSALSSPMASLLVTLTPGVGLEVGDNFQGPNPDAGLTNYATVGLYADSIRITDLLQMANGAETQLTLSSVTATTLNLGGTAYSGWTLGTSDINNINTEGQVTIGGANYGGAINVVGPAEFFSDGTLLVQTTAGNISLVGGSLGNLFGPLIVDAGGSVTNPGGGDLAAQTISITAGTSIGTIGAPILVNATASTFGATANDGGVYVTGLGQIIIGQQGVEGYGGDVSLHAPGIINDGQIVGNNITIGSAGAITNLGEINADGALVISAANLSSSGVLTGTGVTLAGTSALTLEGTVTSNGDLTLSGGAISLTSEAENATLVSGGDITINAQSLSVEGSGDTGTQYSTLLHAAGTLNATISGNMTVIGGNALNGNAAIISAGDSTYTIGGDLNMSGGSAQGAFALLDPTAPGATMNISAAQINLTGGSASGAYAAIVAQGNVILAGTQKISLTMGTAQNADGDVISRTGTITATTPDCVNCTPETGQDPLTNTVTQTGFFGQAAAAPPPAAPPPAPPPAPTQDLNGVGDPANDTLIQDLITLWDTPLDAQKTTSIEGLIFVDGGVDGCF